MRRTRLIQQLISNSTIQCIVMAPPELPDDEGDGVGIGAGAGASAISTLTSAEAVAPSLSEMV